MRSFASVICKLPREHETHAFILVEPPARPGGRAGNPSFCPRGQDVSFESRAARTFRPLPAVPADVAFRLPTSLRGLLDVDESRSACRHRAGRIAGCGDTRQCWRRVMTLLDRRALSSEQPREELPAPRARGAIHRVTEPDCRLGWRGFDLLRGRGRRCSDRVPCPSALRCLCYRREPVIRTR